MRSLTFLLIALAVTLLTITACAGSSASRAAEAAPPAAVNTSRQMEGVDRTDAAAAKVDAERSSAFQARDLGVGGGSEPLGRNVYDRYSPLGQEEWKRQRLEWELTSTIALGADHAAASDIRRQLRQQRQRPQPGTVPVEAFANRITYVPTTTPIVATGGMSVHASMVQCPWNDRRQLAVITAAALPRERPPIDVVWCIDVSGSMGSRERLAMVRDGLGEMCGQLRRDDRVAIVTYADQAEVTPFQQVGDGSALRVRLARLGSGGRSNASAGLSAAFRVAHVEGLVGTPAHVVWLSDGDVRTDVDLPQQVWRDSAGAVGLIAVAVSPTDGDRRILSDCATRAGGEALMLYDRLDAVRLLGRRVAGWFAPVAHDAKMQVFFNPKTIASQRLLGWSQRQLASHEFTDDSVVGYPVPSGASVVAIYEIEPLAAVAPVNPYQPTAGAVVDPNPFIVTAPALRVRLRWRPIDGATAMIAEGDVTAPLMPFAQAPADVRFAIIATAFADELNGAVTLRPWAIYRLAKAAMGDAPDAERRDVLELMAIAAELRR